MSYEGYANSLPINNDRVHFSRISSKDSSFKTQNSSSNRSSAISVQTISKRADRIPLSETFTAQLGRQLRTMFNFRLTRLDPSELLTRTNIRIREN